MTKVLLRKFVSAWQRTEEARWECAEIARLVLAQDGNKGIEELAKAVHVSTGVVREMANVAQRIEPNVRKKFADMLPDTSVEAIAKSGEVVLSA